MPRAPPHTLLLYDCAFIAFRRTGGEEATIAKYSGDVLMLRKGGEASRAQFKRQASRFVERDERSARCLAWRSSLQDGV